MKATLFSIALSAYAPAALACGGLFCDSLTAPVDQTAERILFVLDEDRGEVEVHVQISYEGTADDFAWILPVPAEPNIFPTTDDVFETLRSATAPNWIVDREVEGECKIRRGISLGRNELSIATSDSAAEEPNGFGDDGVRVVDSGQVGPYQTVTLQAQSADELLDWLETRAYYLPEKIGDKLAPYIAEESYFVALRLEKDKDVGDMTPLAFRYAGDDAQIPLQLTAIAARPDMRIQPFVLGSARAVPENYLHVKPNPFLYDWLRPGSNSQEVIAQAANEAGGQAFATDYSGTSGVAEGLFWSEGRYRPSALQGLSDPLEVLLTMRDDAGFPISTGTLPYIRGAAGDWFDAFLNRIGVDPGTYLNCPECFGTADIPNNAAIDGDALATSLTEEWVPAMRHVERLIERHPHLTRLTSSMDAEEMTVDPLFVLNPDADDVSVDRHATIVTFCGKKKYFNDTAPLKLVMDDGRFLWLPPEWQSDPEFDYTGWVGRLNTMAAEVVEQTGRSGAPVVVTDNRASISSNLDELNEAFPTCGCQTGGTTWWWLAGLPVFALRRRRG